MAGRGRAKSESMEHFTLFLPAALLAELREEVEQNGGTVAEKIRFYIESGIHWREKYAQKLTEMVIQDVYQELIDHDPGVLNRQRALMRSRGDLPSAPESPPQIVPSRKQYRGPKKPSPRS